MEEAKSNQPVETDGPVSDNPKKSSAGTVILIVVVVLLVLFVGGYYVSAKIIGNIGKKMAGTAFENATGGKVNVDTKDGSVKIADENGTLEIGSTKWPSDMPSTVPEYKYGKITMAGKTTSGGNTWSIIFEQVSDGSADKYKAELTAKGWTSSAETELGIANTLQMENGNYVLTLIADPSSKVANISVTQKQE